MEVLLFILVAAFGITVQIFIIRFGCRLAIKSLIKPEYLNPKKQFYWGPMRQPLDDDE